MELEMKKSSIVGMLLLSVGTSRTVNAMIITDTPYPPAQQAKRVVEDKRPQAKNLFTAAAAVLPSLAPITPLVGPPAPPAPPVTPTKPVGPPAWIVRTN